MSLPRGGWSRPAKPCTRSARSSRSGISPQCRHPYVESVLDPVELVGVDVVLADLFGKDAVHQFELCDEHRNLEPWVAFDGCADQVDVVGWAVEKAVRAHGTGRGEYKAGSVEGPESHAGYLPLRLVGVAHAVAVSSGNRLSHRFRTRADKISSRPESVGEPVPR